MRASNRLYDEDLINGPILDIDTRDFLQPRLLYNAIGGLICQLHSF